MISIAIMGFGTIGSGVFDVVNINREILKKHVGDEVQVKYVLDIREFPGQPVEKVLVNDVNRILEDPEITVVVETMGGVEPAYTFVKKALEAGKSVATSNKELVAAKGHELMAAAREKGVSFLFEASVGGGIPILRPLRTCLTADRIEEITGILNGTTNYILTKMGQEGTPFETALSEAQAMGFAERRPEADVEGHDACRKLAILLSMVLKERVDPADIYTEGITKITAADFVCARALGMEIKLLADAEIHEDAVFAMVSPFLVKPDNPLYAVRDVFNGILVHGNMVDDLLFYGRGAGKEATASAVVGDVVEMLQHPAGTVYDGWGEEKRVLSDITRDRHSFLIRVPDQEAEAVPRAFPGAEAVKAALEGEAAFVTEVLSEQEFSERAEKLSILGRIRVHA